MASPIGSAGPPGPSDPGVGGPPAGPGDRSVPRPQVPSSPPAPGPAAGTPKGTPVLLPDGWVGTVTDKIVTTVDNVRAKTTVPIEKIGRMVIWGLLIATAGVGLLIVLLVGILRLLYEAVGNIPGISGEHGRAVWIIDVLFGVVLIGLGLTFVKKGTDPQRKD